MEATCRNKNNPDMKTGSTKEVHRKLGILPDGMALRLRRIVWALQDGEAGRTERQSPDQVLQRSARRNDKSEDRLMAVANL